jgi:hypothetical protein
VISDSKLLNGSRPTAMDCFPNSVFTKIHYLSIQPLSPIADTSAVTNFSSTLFECKNSGDLQKLQNMDFEAAAAHDIFIAVNENWNFEAVRKLPWKFHNQGINPIFFDVNKNLNWQRDKSACRKLYDKGVSIPIDLMAVARWQRDNGRGFNAFFGKEKIKLSQQLSAVFLMEVQVAPPYYIYESDIDQWKQWVADGSVKLK